MGMGLPLVNAETPQHLPSPVGLGQHALDCKLDHPLRVGLQQVLQQVGLQVAYVAAVLVVGLLVVLRPVTRTLAALTTMT